MINKILRLLINIIKLLLAYVVCLFIYGFNKNYRDVWLISERGYDARDNGYHLFKYINLNHPEVNIYYVIDYKSADFKKIQSIGKTVNYRSAKHYILFVISKIKISTHIMGYSPDIGVFKKLDKLGLVRGKKVFLQHGIIKDNLINLYYPNIKLDLFVCGAYLEYQYVNSRFKHPQGVVKYLGLCRYDELNTPHKVNKQILLMPTWRSYINKCKSIQDFIQTEYYKVYQLLINNSKLNEILNKYGYNLIYYPHFVVQKYLEAFSTQYDSITIASFKEFDVQGLLKESGILITDFSSVFFDFAYMKKPQIYYQFDESEFRKNHYRKGYFSYKDNGFGPVVKNENNLLQELEVILKNDCKLNDMYLNRINMFFSIKDEKNCQRNFEAIEKLL